MKKTAQKSKKEKLIAKGLPVDWLVRANLANNIETLVYLSQEREKWIDEDQHLVLSIIQEYEKSGKDRIPENNPRPLSRKRVPETDPPLFVDHPDIFVFTCQLLELVKKEPVIWDRVNDPQFGYHQPMRQAWCTISLKLGGWGSMQHVHMLKQFYRRKRDQYNTDFLRNGRHFVYSKQMSFLKDLLEMSNGRDLPVTVHIDEYVKASASDINLESELLAAPEEIQDIIRNVSESIDKVAETCSPEVLAEYLSLCCNEVVDNREQLASAGLQDTNRLGSIQENEKEV